MVKKLNVVVDDNSYEVDYFSIKNGDDVDFHVDVTGGISFDFTLTDFAHAEDNYKDWAGAIFMKGGGFLGLSIANEIVDYLYPSK